MLTFNTMFIEGSVSDGIFIGNMLTLPSPVEVCGEAALLCVASMLSKSLLPVWWESGEELVSGYQMCLVANPKFPRGWPSAVLSFPDKPA